MDTPTISVVIPTWNRCDVLAGTLHRLAAQTLPAERFEVLVVDDGSADRTRDVADLHAAALNLRYLRHENHGPGYTQNRGIREAGANLILLLADDMWPSPRLLECHVRAHEAEPGRNIAVLGVVRQSPDLPATVMHRHWDPFDLGKLDGRRELTSLHFWACNLSCDRRFLLEHGLFRERRGAGNEDTELGYRLSQRGLRILHEPEALVHHHHEVTLAAACRRAFQEGSNFDVMDTIPRDVLLPAIGVFGWEAGLRHALRMLPKEMLRAALFHPWIVKGFWAPVLQLAERFAPARVFASAAAYRGVYGCYYRMGIRDMRRRQRAAGGR